MILQYQMDAVNNYIGTITDNWSNGRCYIGVIDRIRGYVYVTLGKRYIELMDVIPVLF